MHPGRGVAVTASDDRTARVWDLASGEWRHVLRPLAAGNEVGRLYGAAIHPTQPLVAVAGNSGSADTAHLIYLFDLDSGALRRSIDAKAGDVRKLVWSADGTVLLAGYSGTTSSNHGLRAFTLDGRELLDDRHPGPVFGIAVGPGGQAAAVGLDGTLRSYRVGNGAAAVTGNIAISGRRPAGVAFSPDGTRMASDSSLLGTTSSDPQPRLFIRFGGAGLASATSTTAAESLVFTRAGAPFTPTATACPAGSLSNTFCFIDTTQSTSLVTVLNYNGVSVTNTPSTAGLPTAAVIYAVRVDDAAGNQQAPTSMLNSISTDYFVCNQARATAASSTHVSISLAGGTTANCNTAGCHKGPNTGSTSAGTLVPVPRAVPTYWCRRPA